MYSSVDRRPDSHAYEHVTAKRSNIETTHNLIICFRAGNIIQKGVLTLVISQKGNYIYNHREWAIGYFIFISCILASNFWPAFHTGVYGTISIKSSLLSVFFLQYLNMHITITGSEITLQQGFFLNSRTVTYDEVADIIFKDSSKFAYSRLWNLLSPFNKSRGFGLGPKKLQIVIKLKKDNYYVIRSKHAEEILAAISKARPSIKIN